MALSMGMTSDDMRELVNDLWNIHDNVGPAGDDLEL